LAWRNCAPGGTDSPGSARHEVGAVAHPAGVPELSRSQILVYGAVGVALLLVGAKAIRSRDARPAAADASAARPASGTFEVSPEGGGDVVVHVAGAVRRPGVYRLPSGSRVTDAVERAGGAAGRASLDSVNLAARLADGQQVVVPELTPGGGMVAGPSSTDSEGPISLGSATVEELDTIEGIGPVTAQDIVEFRDQHGGLSSIEQLDEISGIGPATMEALREGLAP
jgi:competence protein ComEA